MYRPVSAASSAAASRAAGTAVCSGICAGACAAGRFSSSREKSPWVSLRLVAALASK